MTPNNVSLTGIPISRENYSKLIGGNFLLKKSECTNRKVMVSFIKMLFGVIQSLLTY